MAAGVALRGGKQLTFSDADVDMCADAFKTWLDSMEFELTPGWSLVLAYGLTIGNAAVQATEVPGAAQDVGHGGSAGDSAPPAA